MKHKMLQNIEHKLPTEQPELPLSGNILIVEDDEDILEYLDQLLADRYKTFNASNGQEAIELLEKEHIDLVISDINMPVMDGYEFLHKVRYEHQNLVPFLFLTALSKKHELIQALLLGVDAYVTKPFESDELTLRVQTLLSNNFRRKNIYAQSTHQDECAETAKPERKDQSYRTRWLKNLEAIVNHELSNSNVRIPDLAFQLAISERTFRNRIREYTGLSPNEYMMEARMNKALQLLEDRVYLTVSEVAHAVGLEYSSYFTRHFKERFGKSPSDYV